MTSKIYLIDCPGIVPTSAHDTETSTVLKGVVRVEALPTPSDHIPALMQRVKPVYLARTYGIELPESGVLDPDDFMDKLARMKGRLLKGGGPDMDGVAKIVLSDWCRGRIPFFVPPPERTEELNKKEEEVRKKTKGKAKATKEVKVVPQRLWGILQKNTFVPEDIQPLEVEDPGLVAEGEEAEGDSAEVSDAEEVEEELTWNDVFEGIKPDGSASAVVPDAASDDSPATDVAEEVEDEDEEQEAEQRMKTNKVQFIL